jgi:uncharacterized protein (DUF2164 family)
MNQGLHQSFEQIGQRLALLQELLVALEHAQAALLASDVAGA